MGSVLEPRVLRFDGLCCLLAASFSDDICRVFLTWGSFSFPDCFLLSPAFGLFSSADFCLSLSCLLETSKGGVGSDFSLSVGGDLANSLIFLAILSLLDLT